MLDCCITHTKYAIINKKAATILNYVELQIFRLGNIYPYPINGGIQRLPNLNTHNST